MVAIACNAELNQVVLAGYDDTRNIVVSGILVSDGSLVWGISYLLPGFSAYITEICVGSEKLYLIGYLNQKISSFKTSILLVSLSAQGAVIALCTVSDVSNHVQALAATIDSTTGNSLIVAGVTYTQAYSYINPIVSFLDIGSNSGSVAWSVVLRSSWEGRFTDVLTTAHGVYAVGYSTGFSDWYLKI
jgi:hypothetical protein